MLIEITYNVTDVFMSTTETPVYVEISFEQPSGSAAVWGSITGTLSNQTDLQNALNLKVPYTGATTNVNLGEYELKAGQVTLDTSPTGTAAVGTIRWNDTTGTSETTLKGGNVILKNGVDLVARVVNKVTPNTTLTKAAYQAVRVSGAQGQRLAVAFAQANNDANSADTIGIVIETIPTNQEGFIMTVGQLEGINTTGSLQGETWADGDVLYLSPTTAGALTNIKPTAVTGHIVVIGYVEYAHVNNGKIYVKVMNGWELDELHNVSIITPTNNQGLFYNSSNSLWENKTISTALGYTPVPTTRNITINGVTYDLSADRTYTISTGISGSGAAGQVTYWTGASAVSGSNNLFWDNANGRLGIGTNAPGVNIDIIGTANAYLRVQRGTNSSGDAAFITQPQGTLSASNVSWNYGLQANSNNFRFWYYNGTTTASALNITNSGNVHIGSSADATVRLQVAGDTLLRGSGNTSATTALTVQNSDSANLFRVLNNGQINLGNSASFPYIRTVVSDFTQTPTGIKVIFGTQDTTTGNGSFLFGSNTLSHTSGIVTYVQLLRDFVATSGTGSTTHLLLNGGINQTGGANGITRGLYVNPTLTAAADWRSIEWSNNSGWGLYGDGGASNFLSGKLGIGSTTLTANTLRISRVQTGATSINTILSSGQINSDVTASVNNFASQLLTQAATFTLGSFSHFRASDTLKGAGSTITNEYGFNVDDLTFGNNSFGFYGNIASGTGRWNLYMAGTADNYLAGDLGIGTTSVTNWLNIAASTTAKAHINLVAGSTPTAPANGDIWFDGTDIKMRIGGVTKTFTLI